jgi:SAM-dependent methyltransferase
MKFITFVSLSLKYSPLRAYQHDAICTRAVDGNILDLGGGEKASYIESLGGHHTITSLNISEDANPTIKADITKPFPMDDESFDAALSFNTLEHIPDFETTFAETSRVLKPGARFIIATPFLHQIHGKPHDYWRYSASAFQNVLARHDFVVEIIIPLGKGPFVASYSLMHGIIPKFFRPIAAALSWTIDGVCASLSNRYRMLCDAEHYPLGYFVEAYKHRQSPLGNSGSAVRLYP